MSKVTSEKAEQGLKALIPASKPSTPKAMLLRRPHNKSGFLGRWSSLSYQVEKILFYSYTSESFYHDVGLNFVKCFCPH
jgi:hypothetical protein